MIVMPTTQSGIEISELGIVRVAERLPFLFYIMTLTRDEELGSNKLILLKLNFTITDCSHRWTLSVRT